MNKIHFVIGLGRSGSTLYGSYLSNEIDAIYVGELMYLIERSNNKNHLCGCKKTIQDCDFWGSIIKDLTPKEIMVLRNAGELLKLKNLILRPKKQKELSLLLFKILKNISLKYNKPVVDTSKLFPLSYHLKNETEVTFHLIIRNVRDVTQSMMSSKMHPITGEVIKLHNGSKIKTPLRWAFVNYLYRKMIKPSSIIYFNNKEAMKKYFISTKAFVDHSISGNPSKFEKKFINETNIEKRSNYFLSIINKFHLK